MVWRQTLAPGSPYTCQEKKLYLTIPFHKKISTACKTHDLKRKKTFYYIFFYFLFIALDYLQQTKPIISVVAFDNQSIFLRAKLVCKSVCPKFLLFYSLLPALLFNFLENSLKIMKCLMTKQYIEICVVGRTKLLFIYLVFGLSWCVSTIHPGYM